MTNTTQTIKTTIKGAGVSMKNYGVKAYDWTKGVLKSVKQWFSESKTGQYIVKASKKLLAVTGVVALAGFVTSGPVSAAILGTALYAAGSTAYHAIKVKKAGVKVDWKMAFLAFSIETIHTGFYATLGTLGYLFLSPFFMEWIIGGAVWALNLLIDVWYVAGVAITA